MHHVRMECEEAGFWGVCVCVGCVNVEHAHLGHEDVAQFAAPVRMPTVVRGRGLVFEARVVNGVSMSHVRA